MATIPGEDINPMLPKSHLVCSQVFRVFFLRETHICLGNGSPSRNLVLKEISVMASVYLKTTLAVISHISCYDHTKRSPDPLEALSSSMWTLWSFSEF